MFGQAIIAITNVSGSGRKLTLRSLEIGINAVRGTSNPIASVSTAKLITCTDCYGENMVKYSSVLDSSVGIPSTVVVRRMGGGNNYSSATLRRISITRSSSTFGTQSLLQAKKSWGKFGREYKSQIRGGTDVEPIVVPQDTALILQADSVNETAPLRVHATVSIDGKTAIWEYVTAPMPGMSLFSLENNGTSVVKLLALGLQDVGTTDTPYLRLVPIGQIKTEDFIDTNKQIQDTNLMPMDSTYPSISSVCKIYTDVGFLPLGVPEVYMTDTTAGSPKGYNYLHTKDFNGPSFRLFFPELEIYKPNSTAEDMKGYGHGHLNCDIGVLKSGIVINPGEGIAIVASAETAAGSSTAYSGWQSLHFAAQIDEEPQFSPTLTLLGLQPGSDVVVLYPGTSTVIDSADSIGGTTYSLGYDPDLYTVVDICIYKAGYGPATFRSLNLGIAGVTVPVTQVADRNYLP